MSPLVTSEQRAMRDATRELFDRECTAAQLRACWDQPVEHDRTRWNLLASLGLLGLTVPESFGGLGRGDIDLVLVLEEAGYAGLPEPLVETCAIAVPIIRDFGTPKQRDQWLEPLSSGRAMATAQLMADSIAPYGTVADLALVAGPDGLHVVPGERLDATPVTTRDASRHAARLEASTDESTRVGDAQTALDVARIRGAAATAAVLNGCSRRMLDMAVRYAAERKQFGRAIGSFQAVKHMLADVALEVETARPAAWQAAAELTASATGARVASSVAKSAAAEAAHLASNHALQVHGGIGFTWEHDLHLWLHRGKALEQAYGSAHYHHRILAAAVLEADSVTARFGPVIAVP